MYQTVYHPEVLSPYRRHTRECPHRDAGIGWQRCSCPVWVDGLSAGRRIRQSLRTRNWDRALERIRMIESGEDRGSPVVALDKAVAAFLADCRARNLRDTTLTSYRRTLDHLARFLPGSPTAELTESAIRRFREGRKVKPSTGRKELEHLRSFCAWLATRNWIDSNPAQKLRAPRDTSLGAVPYSADEICRLFDVIDTLGHGSKDQIRYCRSRIRAYMLLLLYSGLRRTDAAALRRDAVDPDGRVTVRTEKTGQPVKVKLPTEVLDALNRLPRANETFFNWTPAGSSWLVNHLWRTLSRVGQLAKIHAYPHRFRDTFAVNLLVAGADIRTVSLLLGHSSIRTTEKHYAHFVPSQQKVLDRATARLKFKTG